MPVTGVDEHPISGRLPREREGLMRKREVAERLDVDVRTIDNYMRRGWIPYHREVAQDRRKAGGEPLAFLRDRSLQRLVDLTSFPDYSHQVA